MLSPPRILVVDDSPPVRKTLERVFSDEGYEVTVADSAEAALERLGERDYDVAVSDILMPGRSGIDLAAELHATRPDTPVVLMTAHESFDSAVDALRAGAFDYLQKPFDMNVLRLSIARALEQRALAARQRELDGERREQRSALSLAEAASQGLCLRALGDLYIEEVLERNGGRKTEAARALGISRKTIYRRCIGRPEDTGE